MFAILLTHNIARCKWKISLAPAAKYPSDLIANLTWKQETFCSFLLLLQRENFSREVLTFGPGRTNRNRTCRSCSSRRCRCVCSTDRAYAGHRFGPGLSSHCQPGNGARCGTRSHVTSVPLPRSVARHHSLQTLVLWHRFESLSNVATRAEHANP